METPRSFERAYLRSEDERAQEAMWAREQHLPQPLLVLGAASDEQR
jgi:hypothetical protein